MTTEFIVKIQKPLFPPDGPALVYPQDRSFVLEAHFDTLPKYIRTAINQRGKVYANFSWQGTNNTQPTYGDIVGDQDW